jgi:hypothetical protein
VAPAAGQNVPVQVNLFNDVPGVGFPQVAQMQINVRHHLVFVPPLDFDILSVDPPEPIEFTPISIKVVVRNPTTAPFSGSVVYTGTANAAGPNWARVSLPAGPGLAGVIAGQPVPETIVTVFGVAPLRGQNVVQVDLFKDGSPTPIQVAQMGINVHPTPPRPPPPPPPPPPPQETTYAFYLNRQQVWQGPIPYAGVFGQGINGKLKSSINPNPFRIGLLLPGHFTSEFFTNPSAAVVLPPGARTSAQNLASIYGSASPVLPVSIVAGIEAGAAVIDLLRVDINYTYQ